MIPTWVAAQVALTGLAVGVWALDAVRARPRAVVVAVRLWVGVAAVAWAVPWPSGWSPPPPASWVPAEVAHGALPLAHLAHLGRVVVPGGGSPTIPLVAAFLGLVAVRMAWAAGLLARLVRATTPVRRIGRVEVRVGPVPGPFAAWWPGRAVVAVDPATWAHREDRLVTVRHELRHHRHRDPVWAWVWLAVGALAVPNPMVGWVVARIRVLEELACDAAVLVRVGRAAYADSLLRVARRARALPVAVPAASQPPLTERIHAMSAPRFRSAPVAPVFAAGLALLVLTSAASGSGGVSDRAFSRAVAAASDSGFRVPADPAVREALVGILGSDRGRAFFTAGLSHESDWSGVVGPALAESGLPAQLAAVPLVESGYRNFGVDVGGGSMAPGQGGTGLWMFIPETARTYGLRVDPTEDQRLDPLRETDAAIGLLTDLHERFGDWGLALAAYNQGPQAVDAAIASVGSRDPLELAAAGALNDYVATVYAAMLLRADPALLK